MGTRWVLLAVSLALVLGASAARAGDFFENANSGKPVVLPEPPRECNDSPSCGCEEKGASGAENGGANLGLGGVGSGSAGSTSPGGKGGDPIELFTGAFEHEVVDLELPGVVPIRFIRRYDSRADYDSPLGYGWSFNYDTRLYRFPANQVVVRSGCGERNPYTLTGGAYALADPLRGRAPALVEATPGNFILTYRSGERAIFGAGGLLEKLEDPQGNRLEFEYLPEKALQGTSKFSPTPNTVMTVAYVRPLSKVKEWTLLHGYTGREVTLEYDATTGRLTKLVASDGREVSYAHQDATLEPTYRGNLAKVTGLEGLVEEYRYEDASGDAHNLTFVRESQWVAPLSNQYDTLDRVTIQQRGALYWTISYSVNNFRTLTRQRLSETPVPPPAVTTFQFDAVGHLTQKIDALGNKLEYTRPAGSPYVDLAKVWKAGAPLTLHKQADLDFDTAGNLTQRRVTLDSGEILTENWSYDHDQVASYQIVSSASSQVFRTEYTFYRAGPNPTDRPINVKEIKRQKSGGGFETTLLAYDGNGQLETITPPAVVPADGLVIRRSYYGASEPGGGPGLLKTIALELGGTPDPHLARAFSYDARGRLASTTDARGATTSFVFDARARLTSTTNALGEQTLLTWRGPNETSPDTTSPGPHLTRIERGRTVADGAGRVTRLRWSVHGELKMIERQTTPGAYAIFATYTYDSEERRKTATDARGRTTSFGWDALRRLTSVSDAATPSNTTTFVYDAVGNRTRITDALLRVTNFVFDDADRLIQVQALGPNPDEFTTFGYDAAGNVTKVTDPKAQETDYAYDALSRLQSVEQPLGQTVQYRYDGRGRLARVVNARGHAIDHLYEPWGALEEVRHYPSEADAIAGTNLARTLAYGYDLEGNLTLTSDDDPALGVSGSLYTISHDLLGRVDTATAHYLPGGDRVLDSAYDRFGERRELKLIQGAETLTHTWTFDALGRLDLASFPGSSPLDFTPFADDTLERITHASGATTDYSYFPQGPLETITLKAGGTTQRNHLGYTVNGVQNITQLSEQHASSDPTESYLYGYDGADRLTSADYPAAYGLPADEVFGYDPAGNREDPADPNLYAYDANNRISASPGPLAYGFDADGNLTSKTGETFGYDFTNRLRSFGKAGTTAAYAYDPFGRRIKKETVIGATAVTTFYLWDGDQLLAEYDGSGARTVRYAYAGGFAPAQAAYKDGAGEDIYDVHTDHLDTPRLLTDDGGTVVWLEAHAAFGKAAVDEDPDGDLTAIKFNVRFPGQYYDAESGLHYNRFRTYDPAVGRYISADPIGQSDQANVFAYSSNRPTSRIDFLGLIGYTKVKRFNGFSGLVNRFLGPGSNVMVPFEEVDPGLTASDFDGFDELMSQATPGESTTVSITQGFNVGEIMPGLGDVAFNLRGEIMRPPCGNASFEGEITANMEDFDFNPRDPGERSWIAEKATRIVNGVPGGKNFKVIISGGKKVTH